MKTLCEIKKTVILEKALVKFDGSPAFKEVNCFQNDQFQPPEIEKKEFVFVYQNEENELTFLIDIDKKEEEEKRVVLQEEAKSSV